MRGANPRVSLFTCVLSQLRLVQGQKLALEPRSGEYVDGRREDGISLWRLQDTTTRAASPTRLRASRSLPRPPPRLLGRIPYVVVGCSMGRRIPEEILQLVRSLCPGSLCLDVEQHVPMLSPSALCQPSGRQAATHSSSGGSGVCLSQ